MTQSPLEGSGRKIGALETDLISSYTRGNLSRRQFVTRGSIMGLSVAFMGTIVAACGDDKDSGSSTGTGDSTGSTGSTIKQGGTLRIASQKPGSPLDPVAMDNLGSYTPVVTAFEYLVGKGDGAALAPMLAESWSPNNDGSVWTFKLRSGVKWHDGKPFTSADVKCTFDMLMGKSQQKFRKNPRKSWYSEVVDVTPKGDFEVAFNLTRPQPSLLALLASGYTPVYPCHVSPGDMRTKPTGTGPFKFVEFKANESIKITRNPDYWKKGLPHLDGIEYTIITNRSTAILGFISGQFDMTFPTEVSIPLLKDVKKQAPNAVCVVEPINVSTNIIVNSSSPPFESLTTT